MKLLQSFPTSPFTSPGLLNKIWTIVNWRSLWTLLSLPYLITQNILLLEAPNPILLPSRLMILKLLKLRSWGLWVMGEIAQTQDHQSNVLDHIASRIENIQVTKSTSSSEDSYTEEGLSDSATSDTDSEDDTENATVAFLQNKPNKQFRSRAAPKSHKKETYRRLGNSRSPSQRSYSAPPRHTQTNLRDSSHKHRHSPRPSRDENKRDTTRPFWKYKKSPPLKWDENGIPICAYCDLSGHRRAECRKRANDRAKAQSHKPHNSRYNSDPKRKPKPFL